MSDNDRVCGFVNVYREGQASNIWTTRKAADSLAGSSRVRVAECHELREGDTILTAAQYHDIAQFAGSLWPEEVREVATRILGIIDGEKS